MFDIEFNFNSNLKNCALFVKNWIYSFQFYQVEVWNLEWSLEVQIFKINSVKVFSQNIMNYVNYLFSFYPNLFIQKTNCQI